MRDATIGKRKSGNARGHLRRKLRTGQLNSKRDTPTVAHWLFESRTAIATVGGIPPSQELTSDACHCFLHGRRSTVRIARSWPPALPLRCALSIVLIKNIRCWASPVCLRVIIGFDSDPDKLRLHPFALTHPLSGPCGTAYEAPACAHTGP